MYKVTIMSRTLLLLLVIVVKQLLLVTATSASVVPVVLWHGMGDSCCLSFSLGAIKTILEEHLPGVYVKSISIGNSFFEDVESGYFINVNDQVSQVCDEISKDMALQNGYNAVGFSQGSQFLRAVAQRCPTPPMRNLISIGGQHQGIYGLPNCPSLHNLLCNQLRRLLHYAAYSKYVQEYFVQAEYWHDPFNEDEYREKSIFLADINNEVRINETYRENLLKLRNFVLVKFLKDTIVKPVETEWFGFYKKGQDVEIEDMKDTALYREDRLGLKELYDTGRLKFLSVDANHMLITDEWFITAIIEPYLK